MCWLTRLRKDHCTAYIKFSQYVGENTDLIYFGECSATTSGSKNIFSRFLVVITLIITSGGICCLSTLQFISIKEVLLS